MGNNSDISDPERAFNLYQGLMPTSNHGLPLSFSHHSHFLPLSYEDNRNLLSPQCLCFSLPLIYCVSLQHLALFHIQWGSFHIWRIFRMCSKQVHSLRQGGDKEGDAVPVQKVFWSGKANFLWLTLCVKGTVWCKADNQFFKNKLCLPWRVKEHPQRPPGYSGLVQN